MKKKFILLVFVIFLLGVIVTFIIGNFSITPHAILDSNYNESININLTKEDALNQINEAKLIILDMLEMGFNIAPLNDSLIEAKNAFEQARYSEILRIGSLNESELNSAREALRFVNWKSINYNIILAHTQKIKNLRDKALEDYDSLSIIEKRFQEYSKEGVYFSPSDEDYLNQAKTAIEEGRYIEAENLIKQARDAIETKKADSSNLAELKRNAQNFIKRNWAYILSTIIIILLVLFFAIKKINARVLKKKIQRMSAEKKILVELMKKTQKDRFNDNKISGLVYNVRMTSYKNRLNKIKQDLPVLEKKMQKK